MSLSKYYENSNGFQPEELVKDAPTKKNAWTPAQTGTPKPFSPQKPLEKANNAHRKPTQNTAPTPPSPQEGGHPASVDNLTTPSPPVQRTTGENPTSTEQQPPEIDLRQYLHTEEAEQRIATAYQQGFQQGQEKAEQDFGDATKMLVRSCQQIDTTRETLLANSTREFQDFALAIAEKVVRTFIAEHDQTIIATIEEALQQAVKSEEFSVYVHPDDYEILLAKAPDLVAQISGLRNIIIKKDPAVERGGAKLESDNCTIDATIAGQFDIIREHIRNSQ